MIAIAVDEYDAVAQVFFVRGGKLIGRDHFYLRVAREDTPGADSGQFSETVLFRNALYSPGTDASV